VTKSTCCLFSCDEIHLLLIQLWRNPLAAYSAVTKSTCCLFSCDKIHLLLIQQIHLLLIFSNLLQWIISQLWKEVIFLLTVWLFC